MNDRKQKLVESGAERLADVLLELARRHDAVDNMVDRLVATPEETIKRFKARLAGIKRSRRFIRWGESAAFARDLADLLEDMRDGVTDPRTGAELTAAFFECDKGALGNCDDSSGHVGDVFRFNARDLFVVYASCCSDKEWLGGLVFKASRTDDYGVRDALIGAAAEYLPEPVMRTLVAGFQKLADKEGDEYQRRHWLYLVESLARQLKDAPLFERTRIASWGSLSTAACVDIARVYLESGDARSALTWLEKSPVTEGHYADKRDELLLEVHGRLGNLTEQAEVAWRMFRKCRSLNSLGRLLAIIGADRKDEVLADEVTAIRGGEKFSTVDAAFLVAIKRYDVAEEYLFRHAGQLNGDDYTRILPLAEAMEDNGHFLCASLLYRALLGSILSRAQTKTYHHGVRYLRRLDRLASSIAEWHSLESHVAYFAGLRLHHGRKSSFWSRYGE